MTRKQVLRFAQDDKSNEDENSDQGSRQHFSECAFLREAEAGQGYALGGFGDFHLYDWGVGRGDCGRAQDCVLGENFAVHFGDKMILAS